MNPQFPYQIKVNLAFKTGKKLERLVKSRDDSLSGVIRTIVEDYFKKLPYRVKQD